ncbi:MAG: CoA transferase [Acidimicrobiales bacterium]
MDSSNRPRRSERTIHCSPRLHRLPSGPAPVRDTGLTAPSRGRGRRRRPARQCTGAGPHGVLGPLCTHGLAVLGADVIHLESTARPDGTRLLAGLRFTEDGWWERSGIFSGLNTNKKGVTVDLTSDDGRAVLRRLLDTCDVLVENYTPRVLDQLGLDVAQLRAERPELIVLRMPGFGLDGPWRDKPAFAFVIEDASGLTWLTGHPDANPVSPYCVGDSNAGSHALFGALLAIQHRRRTGRGVTMEVSMLDAALNIAAEQIVEASATGSVLARDGNRSPTAAPQNLYRCADEGDDEAWVAVSVADDEQWRALTAALGEPEWAQSTELHSAAGRHRRHDDLDRHLGEWCGARSAETVIDTLWPAGVPVGRVLQPHEQGDLPPLVTRRFFETIDHPVAGLARHGRLPMLLSTVPGPHHRRPAPCLGEHNEVELARAGLEADEIGASPTRASSATCPTWPVRPSSAGDREDR